MKKLNFAVTLLALCSCDRGVQKQSLDPQSPQQAQKELQSFPKPSAAELFDLQSKCTTLGQKLMDENKIGPALT